MSGGLTHLSLFTGIGGLDLAGEWAGFETVGQCEWADYPTKVLEKHWPDVPRWRDIRTLTAEDFYARTGMRTVDIISGGFPCQPFSVAGKQKGKGDDRYLWPEMLRVVRELTPRWVVGENVPGIMHIAADDVCKDLEREGYGVGIFNFEASAVGAPHRRERVFFVARAYGNGSKSRGAEPEGQQWKTWVANGGDAMANAIRGGCQPNWERRGVDGIPRARQNDTMPSAQPDTYSFFRNWDIEPDVGRVANGVSNRVDRLKCLGNAVVPQQAYPICQAIADIERRTL